MSRAALPGTIDSMASIANPVAPDARSLLNGRKYYTINCAVCHGYEGKGDGPVVAKGFPGIPLVGPASPAPGRTDGYIWGMIRNGRGLMPTYNRIEELDRWDVVNYVRGLQGRYAVVTGPVGLPGETGDKVPGFSQSGPTRPSPYYDHVGSQAGPWPSGTGIDVTGRRRCRGTAAPADTGAARRRAAPTPPRRRRRSTSHRYPRFADRRRTMSLHPVPRALARGARRDVQQAAAEGDSARWPPCSRVLGLIVFVAGLLVAPDRAWRAYHFNWLFFASLSSAGVMFVAVQRITTARWSRPIVRLLEGYVAFLPVAFVLLLVSLFLGKGHIFPWTHERPPVAEKVLWYNAVFLSTRAIVSFGVITLLSLWYIYTSVRLDVGLLPEWGAKWAAGLRARMRDGFGEERRELHSTHSLQGKLAVILALCFGYGWSLLAFDLSMGLSLHFQSTLYGWWFFMGAWLCSLTAVLAPRDGVAPLPRRARRSSARTTSTISESSASPSRRSGAT